MNRQTFVCVSILTALFLPGIALLHAQTTAPPIQWQKCFGGSGEDIATAIRQTSDSGYIVAGYNNSTDGDVTGNHGNSDFWIVKLSKTGTLEWEKSLGGSQDEVA